MKRTTGQHHRRRALASAASGRAAVVLYACLTPGRDEAETLQELRDYAAARDWVAVAEVIDRSPLELPVDARAEWPKVEELITNRQAEGIVAPSRETYGTLPGDQDRVRTWLNDRHAFSACSSRPTPAPKVER